MKYYRIGEERRGGERCRWGERSVGKGDRVRVGEGT